MSGLLTCWEAAIRSTQPHLPERFILAELGNIANSYIPKVETTIAEKDGVAGFISLFGREVAALFVHPIHQGAGIGSALLSAFPAPLSLEVFEQNLKARAFYHRHGFRQTGERLHEETGVNLFLLALDERP